VPAAAREWGGESVGFVVSKGDGLASDFCLFLKPAAEGLELEEIRICEDEDDLELEEPKFLFKVPFSLCKQVLQGKLDPMQLLRSSQVRVEGDMKKLVAYAGKYQTIGVKAVEQVETTF
jgi:hypothetical protein